MNRIEEASALLRNGRKKEAQAYYDLLKQEEFRSEEPLLALADLARRLGNREDAIHFYAQIAANDDFRKRHVAHYVLGNIYREEFLFAEALFHYRKAVGLRPDFRKVHLLLGNLYRATGDNETALECYRSALRLKRDIFVFQRILLALNYITGLGPESIAKEHFLFGETFFPAAKYKYDNYNINPDRQINIGFVSGDIRLHSVSYFLLPLIENFNCNIFNFYCYSNTHEQDETTKYIKKIIPDFYDITKMNDGEVVRLISKNRIDILIDLSGHTPKNRLSLFARKPAPIQLTYIGYPNTTGLKAIDYRIVDAVTDPEGGSEKFNSEKLLRLQHNFSCFRSLDKDNIVPSHTIPCEQNKYITFGSFNDITKLNDQVIQTWTHILNRIPGSRLLLKTKSFRSEYVRNRYRDKFREFGLENPDRVTFIARIPSRDDHLKAYDLIDIGLDTFPYNGTTTSYQALSMGVPVITLIGDTHAGRVGYSLLSHMGAGAEELAGKNLEEYVRKAVALANDPARILRYKRTLRGIMNDTVCNEKRYIQEIEPLLINLFHQNLGRIRDEHLPEREEKTVTITGDLILARRMHSSYHREGIKGILGDCLDIFQHSDLNICNLETVISDVSSPFPKKERNPYYFRASTSLARLLTQVPFHVCITANNHAMDYGGEGLAFQEKFLDECDILHCGTGLTEEDAMKPVYVNVGDTTIAILSFDCVQPASIGATRSSPGVFYINKAEDIARVMKAPISRARENADLVFISPHWIENWETTPSVTIRKAARELIDLGCDAILGHSSHLVHPIEIYKNKPILYDMGTFLVDSISGHAELRNGAIFQIALGREGINRMKMYPVLLANGRVRMAPERQREHIFANLLSLADNGLANVPVFNDGKALIVPLESRGEKGAGVAQKKARFGQPVPRIRYANHWLSRKPSIVSAAFPTGRLDGAALRSREGFTVSTVFTPESFQVNSGFFIRVALQNVSPLAGRYEVHIRGRCVMYGSVFDEFHPFANGLYGPELWEKGENVVDETFVRPPRNIRPGLYALFWGLKEMDSGRYVQFEDGSDFALIADRILALPRGINPYASGVDWDGEISPELREKFIDDFGVHSDANLFLDLRNRFAGNKPQYGYAMDALEIKSNFQGNRNIAYLTVFQENGNFLRWGSGRPHLHAALDRDIEKIRANKNFAEFERASQEKCGILIEILQAGKLLRPGKADAIDSGRRGMRIIDREKRTFILLPTEAGQLGLTTIEEQIGYLRTRHNIREKTEKLSVEVLGSFTLCQFKGHIGEFDRIMEDCPVPLYRID